MLPNLNLDICGERMRDFKERHMPAEYWVKVSNTRGTEMEFEEWDSEL